MRSASRRCVPWLKSCSAKYKARAACADAAAVERIGADERLGFGPGGAIHHQQRTAAGPVGGVLQRSAKHDFSGACFQKLLMGGAVRVAQRGGIGAVETEDGVHGMFVF